MTARPAARSGVVFGLVAALALLAGAIWLGTATLSTTCTASAGPGPGGTLVETPERCYGEPSHWEEDGLRALAALSVPALLCLAALTLTPVAALRGPARWLVAVVLMLGFPLAAFTPYAYPLLVGGVLMAVSAGLAHASRPSAWGYGPAPRRVPRW